MMPRTWHNGTPEYGARDMDLEDTVSVDDVTIIEERGCLELLMLLFLPLIAMDGKDLTWSVSEMLSESATTAVDNDVGDKKGCLELMVLLPFIGVMYYVYQILSG